MVLEELRETQEESMWDPKAEEVARNIPRVGSSQPRLQFGFRTVVMFSIPLKLPVSGKTPVTPNFQ